MNWVIMPYLDAWEYTYQAAQDVLAQSLPDVHLLLIDNGSEKRVGVDTREQLGDRVVLWRHDPPLLSLAATWNRALQFVWDAGGQHALVVNNDVRLHPATYETLLDVRSYWPNAWFVTGVGIQDTGNFETLCRQYPDAGALAEVVWHVPGEDLGPPGGPDFSCFLITRECHRWFQFDERFIPAYHEDNDYHRRLRLAGFGDRIFGVNLPFLHYGSRTINRSPEAAEAFRPRFEACREYYVQKWGGVPGAETFTRPFNDMQGVDARWSMTGQGRAPWTLPLGELFNEEGHTVGGRNAQAPD